MLNPLIWLLVVAGLVAGMLGLLEVGRWIGVRRLAADPDGARVGVGAVEGAMFALMGLLIAFTLYVTVDLESPRIGWIRVDSIDQALIDLQASMGD